VLHLKFVGNPIDQHLIKILPTVLLQQLRPHASHLAAVSEPVTEVLENMLGVLQRNTVAFILGQILAILLGNQLQATS